MKSNMNMTKNNACYLCKAKKKNWEEIPKEEQWVYGYYAHGITPNEKPIDIILDPTTVYDNNKTDGWYEIDLSTLCRCIGLKDKEDKLIWENDIVKIGTYKYLVWWNREGQEMTAVPIKGICFSGADYYSGNNPKFTYHDFICMMQDPYGDFIDRIEVVGSIIDNPKLLDIKEKSYDVDNNLDEIDL